MLVRKHVNELPAQMIYYSVLHISSDLLYKIIWENKIKGKDN